MTSRKLNISLPVRLAVRLERAKRSRRWRGNRSAVVADALFEMFRRMDRRKKDR